MLLFLYGEDNFRSRKKLFEIIDKFKREVDPSGLEILNFKGENFDLDQFKNAVFGFGLFGKKKLIIIKNFSENKKDLSDEIFNITQDRFRSDDIIVFYESEKVDLRTKFFKKLAEEKYSYEFRPLSGEKLTKWILDKTKERGGKIDTKTAELLASLVGNNLWQLDAELNKLIAYDKNISKENVELLVHSKFDSNIFNLMDAISEKNKPRTFKLISQEFKNGTDPIYILSMIIRQFRILLQAKDEVENNGVSSQFKLANTLGLHPFVASKAFSQVKNFTLDELKKIYKKLLELEHKIKTTSIPKDVLLEAFLVDI